MKVSPSYPQNDLLFYIKINSLREVHRQKKKRALRHQTPEHSSIDCLITPTWSIHVAWWSVSDSIIKENETIGGRYFRKSSPKSKQRMGAFANGTITMKTQVILNCPFHCMVPTAQLLTINNINTTSAKHKTRGNVPFFYPKTHHILHYFWHFFGVRLSLLLPRRIHRCDGTASEAKR